MGYVKKYTDQILVQAVLTKRGKQLLASGRQNFKIAKFALSDDEIDYSQTDQQILQTPILQPSTDSAGQQLYKLVSFQHGIDNLIIISTSQDSLIFGRRGDTHQIIPTSYPMGDKTLGYTFEIPHGRRFKITGYDSRDFTTHLPTEDSTGGIGQQQSTVTVSAHSIRLQYDVINSTPNPINFNIRITGNQTGASKIIAVSLPIVAVPVSPPESPEI